MISSLKHGCLLALIALTLPTGAQEMPIHNQYEAPARQEEKTRQTLTIGGGVVAVIAAAVIAGRRRKKRRQQGRR